MRVRVSIVVAAALVPLIALTGCAPPANRDPSPPMSESTQSGFAGDLRDLLLPHPVSTVDISGDGTVGLEDLAAEYKPDDVSGALAKLREYGYQRIASTAWRDEKTDVAASAYLIQFADVMGASAWAVDVQRGLTVRPELATAADFDQIDDGRWFVWTPLEGHTSVTGVFAKKTIVAWVSLSRPVGDSARADLANLCEAQARRLP